MLTIFGEFKNPFEIIMGPEKGYSGEIGENFGLLVLLNNILRLVFLAAGLFALIQLIMAGYGFMTSAGDPKGISSAWGKIWSTLLGLVIIVGSFVLAAIAGQLFFGDPMAILQPKLYGVIN